MAFCTSPHTCLSVKWYWHSFFHSSLSSLSTWRSGATWPRLTRSLPSLSRCMMFSCKHNGRSVRVVPLKAGCKRHTELSSQEAGNLRNPSLQHSYCFFTTSSHREQSSSSLFCIKQTFYMEILDLLPHNCLR